MAMPAIAPGDLRVLLRSEADKGPVLADTDGRDVTVGEPGGTLLCVCFAGSVAGFAEAEAGVGVVISGDDGTAPATVDGSL
jgi:hypothetical protein